jgi:hypothetical protein
VQVERINKSNSGKWRGFGIPELLQYRNQSISKARRQLGGGAASDGKVGKARLLPWQVGSPSKSYKFVAPLKKRPGGAPWVHLQRPGPEILALKNLKHRLKRCDPHNLRLTGFAEAQFGLKDFDYPRRPDDGLSH